MIKKFNQFVNENNSYIDWSSIEAACANTQDLPDCIPVNVRQWDVFIRQYERAVELVNGTWEPHYDWNTKEEFIHAVNEQFYLGKGYKNSIYECYEDIEYDYQRKYLFKNVDWNIIWSAAKFTKWYILLGDSIDSMPLLPKKVGGDFYCDSNGLTTLEGVPNHIGGDFYCGHNSLTSLEGGPKYVGGTFDCSHNKLTSLEGAPDHVGKDFNCNVNQLTSLKGAPNYVGNDVYCSSNKLHDSIPGGFKAWPDLQKYKNL